MEKLEVLSGAQSKSEYVYQILQEQILTGACPPGMPLFIRELSTQLNVSRTPVKEAISRLAYDGYVELLPNRCAIVARISSSEILELLEVREALECSSAFYAAQRRTDADIVEMLQISNYHRNIPYENVEEMVLWDRKLHMAIAKATNNQQIYAMLDKVFEKLTRISLPISRDRLADSVRQHEAILNAIRQRNAEEARRMMMDHDRDVLASVKAFQYQNIHLFK